MRNFPRLGVLAVAVCVLSAWCGISHETERDSMASARTRQELLQEIQDEISTVESALVAAGESRDRLAAAMIDEETVRVMEIGSLSIDFVNYTIQTIGFAVVNARLERDSAARSTDGTDLDRALLTVTVLADAATCLSDAIDVVGQVTVGERPSHVSRLFCGGRIRNRVCDSGIVLPPQTATGATLDQLLLQQEQMAAIAVRMMTYPADR